MIYCTDCCACFIFSGSIPTQTLTSFCFGSVNRLSHTSKSNEYVLGRSDNQTRLQTARTSSGIRPFTVKTA
jgi:hypothetical protein